MNEFDFIETIFRFIYTLCSSVCSEPRKKCLEKVHNQSENIICLYPLIITPKDLPLSPSGVYVEKVGETGSEGPYTGLLGVGDEILQVNGEAVAGLSLDQVTRLMTRESIATLRIMPAYRIQR